MYISVIGDADTVTGFRMCGITHAKEISEGEDAAPVLKELTKDDEAAIIIITEKIAESIRSFIDEINLKKKGVVPIIIEIPDKSGKLERELDPLKELIRRAIGIELK
ncbi:MAG: V-type ATP synthase subunit F [Halobacteriota archaeon]|nr:V-type ATP synthase subunit F [Halobacteriota archaeon]MDY6958292.1 V-type ATP synthase subunit F [Halobacteriota archaeon]